MGTKAERQQEWTKRYEKRSRREDPSGVGAALAWVTDLDQDRDALKVELAKAKAELDKANKEALGEREARHRADQMAESDRAAVDEARKTVAGLEKVRTAARAAVIAYSRSLGPCNGQAHPMRNDDDQQAALAAAVHALDGKA